MARLRPSGLHPNTVTDRARRGRSRNEFLHRQFVANASHELRTPVAAILAAVDALRSGVVRDPDVQDRFLGHVERSTRRLAELYDGLVALAAAETDDVLRPGDVAVRASLESIAGELRPADGVTVSVHAPEDLTVHTDGRLLDLALRNLAGNAAKFTEHGAIDLDARVEHGEVVIEVRDTGCGMSPTELRRCPERFWRADTARSTPGSGLGLAIVEQACAALGAGLVLDSSPGDGTVARIEFHHAHP